MFYQQAMNGQASFLSSMAQAFVLWCLLGTVGYTTQPGELLEQSIGDHTNGQTLRLRYCPPGAIYPGRPNPGQNMPGLEIAPIQLSGFYLGETEVTLAQFRHVLGEEGMTSLKAEAGKFQASNPQLLALIKNGQDEPAFFVGLDRAIQFCLKLQSAIDAERSRSNQITIETRRIRLPSHIEWQYAGRAISDPNQQFQRASFNRSLSISDLTPANQEKCREVWAKIGRTDPFIAAQDQLLALTTVMGANEQSKVREILAEVYQKLIGGPVRSSANGIGTVPWNHLKQASDLPNSWKIFDLHDNVTEWVIWASTADRRDELWKTVCSKVEQNQSLNGQPSVFLAGGFYSDSIQNLSHFTLWGGPKVPDGTASPQEFEYQSDLVSEFSPGFRILMERMIASDWLWTLRKGIYDHETWNNSAHKVLDESEQLLKELADSNHPGFEAIAFYRGLLSLSHNERAVSVATFENLSRTSEPANSQKKLSLAELLNEAPATDSSTANHPSETDDDQLFWRTLTRVHKSHSNLQTRK